MKNLEAQKQLLGLFLLQDELYKFDQELVLEENYFNMFRLLKQNVLALNTFYDTLYRYEKVTKEHPELKNLTELITKKHDLISYLTTKIGGYLDDEIVVKSLQRIPHIFHKKSKEFRDVQIDISYQAVLETAIKCFIEETPEPRSFNTEIHLNIAEERDFFFLYIANLNRDCVAWTTSLIQIIEKNVAYLDDDEILYQMRIADSPRLNRRKRAATPYQPNLEDDGLVSLAIAEYEETDKRKKIELLNRLVIKLGEKIQEVVKMQ